MEYHREKSPQARLPPSPENSGSRHSGAAGGRPRTRRIAALSTACAVVVSVGAGSAMFVELPCRPGDGPRRGLRAGPCGPANSHCFGQHRGQRQRDGNGRRSADGPAARDCCRCACPDRRPSENAIEVPLDDPTAKPILHLDQIETAALEETGDAADPEVVPAVANDEPAESTDTGIIPEAEIKPSETEARTGDVERIRARPIPNWRRCRASISAGWPAIPASESTAQAVRRSIVKSVNLRAQRAERRQGSGCRARLGQPSACLAARSGAKFPIMVAGDGSTRPSLARRSRPLQNRRTAANQASASDATGRQARDVDAGLNRRLALT